MTNDHAGEQELISYDLATRRLLWRFPAKLCRDVAWQEPQGLFVSDLGVLSGNPMIYVGFTNRIYTGDSFVRQHVIKRLRDPPAF
jgi:outer membrane protein assembly factor BamB